VPTHYTVHKLYKKPSETRALPDEAQIEICQAAENKAQQSKQTNRQQVKLRKETNHVEKEMQIHVMQKIYRMVRKTV